MSTNIFKNNMKGIKEKLIELFLKGAAQMSILIVLLIFLFLFRESLPFLEEKGFTSLWNTIWRPVSFKNQSFGILALINSSLFLTFWATLIAIPFGIFGAVYLAEMAGSKEREFFKPFIELLAGIPSVVLGFFGLTVLGPIIQDVFSLQSGLSALTGAILLALMAIPTIISISEDAIRNVPKSYKEASIAMGASKLQTTWRVVVPAASSGILVAIMLGMGRVIGETMTVMMVTGNAAQITYSLFESVRTMTATIAAEMGEVQFGSEHYSSLFLIGIVLLMFTLLINFISKKIIGDKAK